MIGTWPEADLDPVRKLRVLASAIPNAVLVERVIAVPYETVWRCAEDLEDTVPRIQSHVRSLRITERDGDRLVVDVRGHLGARARMDAVLTAGWCVMQSRFLRIGMAATPEDGGTRFARLVALRFPGSAAIAPLTKWNLTAEIRRLERIVG